MSEKKKVFQDMQGVFSFGYIYLILMGILNQSLYYNQIGVEILKYSNILDVLLSPISRLTSGDSKGIIFLLVLIFAVLFLPSILAKRKEKAWFKKAFKLEAGLTENQTMEELGKAFMVMAAVGIFGFFVGTGIGGALKINKQIKNNEIEYNDTIHFVNGDVSKVAILGKNSSYVFYFTEENYITKVTPIGGVVKSIEEVQ